MNETIIAEASNIAAKYPLRALDSVQLTCGLLAARSINQPLTFVSADNNLLTAATAEGLATDNPNLHP